MLFPCGLLVAVAPLVVEHRLQVHRSQEWQPGGSVAVARGLSGSQACGILPDQGMNGYLSHCKSFLTTGPPGKPPHC